MAGTRWIIEVLNWKPDGWESVPDSPTFASRRAAAEYCGAAASRDGRMYRAVQVPMEVP